MLTDSSTDCEMEIYSPLLDLKDCPEYSTERERKMKISDKWPLWAEIFAAEFLGTALLMFFGCMGLFGSVSKVQNPSPMQGGLVFGFVISSIIVAIGHISNAHLNPVVTLCAYLLGNIQLITAFIYFLAEMFGALIGFWFLKASTPKDLLNSYVSNNTCGFCNTVLHPNVSVSQGFLIEFLATSFLIFIVCSVWDSRNTRNTDSVALRFGLYIAAISIAAGPFTGASMNPARSFSPALVNDIWDHHWIYWIAPFCGSLVMTLFYKYAFAKEIYLEENEIQPHLIEPILSKS